MAHLGILLPDQAMAELAAPVIETCKSDIVYERVIKSSQAISEARKAVEFGAEIIIARGYQALQIKKYTNIPVAEIRIHAQEIGLLLKKAKQITQKERPVVGLVVFSNMLADMSCMEELFDVELKIEYMDCMEDALPAVKRMIDAGVDIFIGGRYVAKVADSLGYVTLFYGTSVESIKEALFSADRMAFSIEVEKQNQAQFETVLDVTFNGIIKINADGKITVVNKLVEDLVGKNMDDIVGLPAKTVFPEFDYNAIQSVLSGKRDSYTTSVNLRNNAWILHAAPIQYEEKNIGVILSLQKVSEDRLRKHNARQEMMMNGYVANTRFQDISTEDESMKNQIELAKRYALSERPVLIYTEEGTEYYKIAEAIHNNSSRNNSPFVSINIGAISKDRQIEVLFGGTAISAESTITPRLSAMTKAQFGTLLIKEIDMLSMEAQYQLSRSLFSQAFTKTDIESLDFYDARIIATSKRNLSALVSEGLFCAELYYQIQGLVLHIPPLHKRPEDLTLCFNYFFDKYNRQYMRYLTMTKDVIPKVLSLEWPGNHLQIKSFCERLVLTAEKHRINESNVQKLYDSLYPKMKKQDGRDKIVVYQSPEADVLNELLEKHHGNRQAMANELGISTTTLWRKLKKYGLN